MKVITVINQKGGVAKTTTAHALGNLGGKILFIDLDPQENLSNTLQIDEYNENTIYNVLVEGVAISKAISSGKNFDAVVSSDELTGADLEITGKGKESKLKKALLKLGDKYDYVIIDTPPSLNILTINALVASDYVLIPAGADVYSIQGTQQLMQTINAVHDAVNPELKVLGIVLTRYNRRSNLSRQLVEILDEITPKYGIKVYKSTIREAVAIKEAQANKESIFEYAKKSNVAQDYADLIKEIKKDMRGK